MSKRVQSGHCTDALNLAVRTNAFLKTKMCPRLDSCPLGKNCSYAHSDRELRPLPEFKKTAICYNFRRGRCFDPHCKFAHGEEEMMGYIPEPVIQTGKICPYYVVGICSATDCANSHIRSRRSASRLRTFLVALRNVLSGPFGEATMSVSELKKRLKGGIPWQSVGFSTFEEAVLFLPGTELSSDGQFVRMEASMSTRNLIQTLTDFIEEHESVAAHTPTNSSVFEVTTPSSILPAASSPFNAFSLSCSHGGLLTSTINPRTQVVSPSDDSVEFFTCPVCHGLSVDPLISVQCSHVFCAGCLELWKSCTSERVCPKCHTDLMEIDVLSTESPHTTSAALGVIYDSIQVRCESCSWVGSPRQYSTHFCSPVDPSDSHLLAVTRSFDPGILTVQEGDLLEVSAESESGWAFVHKPTTQETGWTPRSNLRSPTDPEQDQYRLKKDTTTYRDCDITPLSDTAAELYGVSP